MCILQYGKFSDFENVEWPKENEVDYVVNISINDLQKTTIPQINSIKNWIQNPWADCLALNECKIDEKQVSRKVWADCTDF